MAGPEGPGRMPILPVGKVAKRAAQAGFTLIELMVVVAIIAILSVGVGLGTGGVFARASGTPRAVSLQLIAAIERARDAAILGRVAVGVQPRADGWQIVQRDVAGGWQATAAPVAIRGISLTWSVAGQSFLPRLAAPTPADTPPLMFLPDGRGVAFTVTLGDRQTRATCQSDGWGPVTCQ